MDNSGLHYYYPVPSLPHKEEVAADICIYGATASGVVAAVECARAGKRVVLVEFSKYIGGMTTSGLGATDTGDKHVIGGLSRQFYRELGSCYGKAEEWHFEPSMASRVFKEWIQSHHIPVYIEHRLDSVEKKDRQITVMHTEIGRSFKASVFIDASYEGDLLACAGVSNRIGREGNEFYDEHFNGVFYGGPHHNFLRYVDPYRVEGNPASGLLSGISDLALGHQGEGDYLTQAYNFRLCLTPDPANKVPFTKPAEYDPERYELLKRYIDSGVFDIFNLTVPLQSRKFDHNNWGAVNSDNIGENYDWPRGDYAKRELIYQEHVNYQKGLFWFLSNDTRLPPIVRQITSWWGLAADEFKDTGHWPPQLYVREARRMISDYVISENNAFALCSVEDPVGMASYTMDSHNCKRVVVSGRTINEGNIEVTPHAPFAIPYRAIRPRRDECTNLLVPVCLSASHSAYGSVRMEPVLMILGQSAGIAAVLAINENDGVVQDVSYSSLEKLLRSAGQILDEPKCFPEKLKIIGEPYWLDDISSSSTKN